MVKHTQTIHRQIIRKLPANCLSEFDHFVKLALKGLIAMRQLVVPFKLKLLQILAS